MLSQEKTVGELTDEEKEINTKIASIRIRVEHRIRNSCYLNQTIMSNISFKAKYVQGKYRNIQKHFDSY